MNNFLDLFSGIGGFALGAEWAGIKFDSHFFSEVDDYAISVYKKRFPEAIGLGDIRGIHGRDLPAGDWIIAGGFPCQDISIAGKGAGLDGGRSGLWFEYARIIGELRPRFAIMENVGALTIRGLDKVLGSLTEIGYAAEWQDIRASDVGAPHRRERIWIVAYPECDGFTSSARTKSTKETIRKKSIREDDTLDTQGAGRLSTTKGNVVDTDCERCEKQHNGISERTWNTDCESSREVMAYPKGSRMRELHAGSRSEGKGTFDLDRSSKGLANSGDDRLVERIGELREDQQNISGRRDIRGGTAPYASREWWSTEPDVGRVAHGIPSRVDRLKCLGNSIVPQIAKQIFIEIMRVMQ